MPIFLFIFSRQNSAHPHWNFHSNQSTPGRFNNIGEYSLSVCLCVCMYNLCLFLQNSFQLQTTFNPEDPCINTVSLTLNKKFTLAANFPLFILFETVNKCHVINKLISQRNIWQTQYKDYS